MADEPTLADKARAARRNYQAHNYTTVRGGTQKAEQDWVSFRFGALCRLALTMHPHGGGQWTPTGD